MLYIIDCILLLFFCRVTNVAEINSHIKAKHGISVDVTNWTFSCFSAFTEWKEEEERVTHSLYVMHNAPKTINDLQHYYYYCNRTGAYKSRGNKERAIKSQGTSKTNSFCSAYMKAVICLKTGSVIVAYAETHYNHQKQLGHLHLSNTTRTIVAEKLKQGITSSRIIEDVRGSGIVEGIFREHLISEKDVNNIRKQFNVGDIKKHSNDFVSVATVVEEMETLDYNAILLFKQQGEKPNDKCALLDIHDFLLVFQTEFQNDMFVNHGHKGVCIDATYNINEYDFLLITLLVLDDYQEGIPIAWGISNREDKLILKYFFQALKAKCGNINSAWFMSDMASQYFNAWKEVFDSSNTKYLWCAWHVDRAWRKAIKKYFKSLDEQRKVYHQLRVIMMETSKTSFQILLTKFLTSHVNSPPFIEYFQSYCHHSEQWALCFRVGTPVNTNMYSESFHRVLKICYLNHKYNRRLDTLIHILKKIARDKVFQQLQKMEKGKHTHRICEINRRHKHAESFCHSARIINEGDNTYAVSSESRLDFFYTVKKTIKEL